MSFRTPVDNSTKSKILNARTIPIAAEIDVMSFLRYLKSARLELVGFMFSGFFSTFFSSKLVTEYEVLASGVLLI